MKSRVGMTDAEGLARLPPSAFRSSDGGREMAGPGVELVLGPRTTVGRLLGWASMAHIPWSSSPRPMLSSWRCTPPVGLEEMTWAPLRSRGELAGTELRVTVWPSLSVRPLMMTLPPVPEIRELPLRRSGWEAVRKPPVPLRNSWPPVLQGAPAREMREAVEEVMSSGLSEMSSMLLPSSSVLWLPSDSLEDRKKETK